MPERRAVVVKCLNHVVEEMENPYQTIIFSLLLILPPVSYSSKTILYFVITPIKVNMYLSAVIL